MGSSHGQQTIQGACVSETAVHDHGRRLNQREFRPMAEVAFRPARQLSEYKGKGASASRERDDDGDMINLSEDPSGFAFGEMLRSAKEVKDRSTKRFFFRQVKSIHHYREKLDELSWKRRFLRLLSITSRLVYNRSNYLSHQHRLRIPPQRQLQNMLKKVP